MDTITLKKLQETELNILIALDCFCTKHNIKYSLYAGTAIGAVRHDGFIPWDDDIDVVMTRGEYNRFINLITIDPIEGFTVVSPELNDDCAISHAKLIMDGTLLLSEGEIESVGNHGIWVDVFPLDKITKRTKNKIYNLGIKIILLTRANEKLKNDTFGKSFIRRCIALIPKPIREKCMNHYLDELKINDTEVNSDFWWTELAAMYTFKYSFEPDIMEHLHRIKFERHDFLIVDDYDSMLSQLYGDYMKLPPASEQVCKHTPVKIVFKQ